RRGEYEEAFPLYSEVLEIYTDLNDKKARADALWGLAEVHRLRREYEEAIPLYYKAWEICSDIGDRQGKAAALLGLADTRHDQGDDGDDLYQQVAEILEQSRILADPTLGEEWPRQDQMAFTLYSEALPIFSGLGHRKGLAGVLWGLAEIHRSRREYEKAIHLYYRDLEILTELGDREGRANASQRQEPKAIPLYFEALHIFAELGHGVDVLWGPAGLDLGDRQRVADALQVIAKVHWRRSQYNEATQLYSKVLEIRTRLGDKLGRAYALWRLARVHLSQLQDGIAILLYSEALQIFTELGHRKGQASMLWDLPEMHRCRSEYDMAIQFYSGLLQVRNTLHVRKHRASALFALAEVRRTQSRWADALSLFEEAAEVANQLGHKETMAEALTNAANARQMLRSQAVAGDLTEIFHNMK
ncbi:hypothetical protein FS837_002494, partial [Tulasnella sp. UAMH 9824]